MEPAGRTATHYVPVLLQLLCMFVGVVVIFHVAEKYLLVLLDAHLRSYDKQVAYERSAGIRETRVIEQRRPEVHRDVGNTNSWLPLGFKAGVL